MISTTKRDLINDMIIRIFRVIVNILLNITLVVLIPSKNAEALLCVFYLRAIGINLATIARFYFSGEKLFQSRSFLLSYILLISSQILQFYSAFAAEYTNTLFGVCVVFFSVSLLIQTVLGLNWLYEIKTQFRTMSVPKVNSCVYFIAWIISSIIYGILVIVYNGTYTTIPLTASNYACCLLVLTATFLAKRNAVMDVLLKEVCKI